MSSCAASDLISMYEKMLFIRRFEERAGQLYGMGEVGGFCHLYIGQEAVAVGVEYCLTEEDSVITSYRDHGVMIARGSPPEVIMSELLGRASGCSGGKGGSMHVFDVNRNFFGGHGIVGAQVSLGTGMALACKYRGSDSVSVVYFGDGAANQGQVYESFNMAVLWNLPVLYAIENNMYSMGSAVGDVSATALLSCRGRSFDIPGYSVDGMDLMEVVRVTKDALAHIRSGCGPAIVEYNTYRFRGHSMSDPATYRSKDEVAAYKKRDPIEALEKQLLDSGNIAPAAIAEIRENVKRRVAECVTYAQSSAFPDSASVFTNVYCL
ncbi:pyruvate dehydrogenase (acetyl-transferring) E1 component, alpha subunit [Neorickettsia helminthoeca str. Oregon]|uniref:Pyruvate dehydrogenase E1 component subunit alpha n=1 Tax=Neorickettsia helminthoeca str. Oregon TaxID=1286528 RepID=X5H4Q6_9RICK|nr:pyruvate dehydrogenase (acetyl-transferring) E1 component subunit alpha [Neorickettsia helminthoeca]AHX11693.1 pyruvate dehydrogenase (acetyl-transferring) E1 component, alpha subunit [Neorickettsia helminthoeca str. Oregon]